MDRTLESRACERLFAKIAKDPRHTAVLVLNRSVGPLALLCLYSAPHLRPTSALFSSPPLPPLSTALSCSPVHSSPPRRSVVPLLLRKYSSFGMQIGSKEEVAEALLPEGKATRTLRVLYSSLLSASGSAALSMVRAIVRSAAKNNPRLQISGGAYAGLGSIGLWTIDRHAPHACLANRRSSRTFPQSSSSISRACRSCRSSRVLAPRSPPSSPP